MNGKLMKMTIYYDIVVKVWDKNVKSDIKKNLF